MVPKRRLYTNLRCITTQNTEEFRSTAAEANDLAQNTDNLKLTPFRKLLIRTELHGERTLIQKNLKKLVAVKKEKKSDGRVFFFLAQEFQQMQKKNK